MTIRKKLFLGIGLLVLIILGQGFGSQNARSMISGYSTELADKWLPQVEQVKSIDTLVSDLRVNELNFIVATSPQEMNQVETEMGTIQKDIDQNLANYEKTISSEQERNLLNKLKSELINYYQLNQQVISLSRNHKTNEAMGLMKNESLQAFHALKQTLSELVKYSLNSGVQVSQEGATVASNSILIDLAISLIALLLGLTIAFILDRMITKPIMQIKSAANQLAEGHLVEADVVIKNQDEIGSLAVAFNKMKNNLKKILGEMTNSSNDISNTALALTSQTEQTAAAATENAASVEEIASTLDQVVSNTSNVAANAQRISGNASNGVHQIEQVNKQIYSISESSEKAGQVIGDLSNTLVKVNQIVDVITSIADQTNLLALNAAIEAARAGDQGRGFAVVADEVRKLAEQSAGAAKEIYTLINSVQAESGLAVQAMDEGNHDVKEGVRIAHEAREILKSILNEISDLSEKMENVATASEQVSAGVQNVASSTEEQTAAIQEVSAATTDLQRIAMNMNALVEKFNL